MHHSRRVQTLVIQRVTKRLQLFLRHPLERRIQDQRGGVSPETGTLIVSANCSTSLLQASHRYIVQDGDNLA